MADHKKAFSNMSNAGVDRVSSTKHEDESEDNATLFTGHSSSSQLHHHCDNNYFIDRSGTTPTKHTMMKQREPIDTRAATELLQYHHTMRRRAALLDAASAGSPPPPKPKPPVLPPTRALPSSVSGAHSPTQQPSIGADELTALDQRMREDQHRHMQQQAAALSLLAASSQHPAAAAWPAARRPFMAGNSSLLGNNYGGFMTNPSLLSQLQLQSPHSAMLPGTGYYGGGGFPQPHHPGRALTSMMGGHDRSELLASYFGGMGPGNRGGVNFPADAHTALIERNRLNYTENNNMFSLANQPASGGAEDRTRRKERTLQTALRGGAEGGGMETFPMVLHRALAELELVAGGPEIASFLPTGDAFLVKSQLLFQEQVLPVFFPRMKSFASFQRQLNLYDFKRVGGSGADRGAYKHELFVRAYPTLSSRMKRTKIKGGLPIRGRKPQTPGRVEDLEKETAAETTKESTYGERKTEAEAGKTEAEANLLEEEERKSVAATETAEGRADGEKNTETYAADKAAAVVDTKPQEDKKERSEER